MLFVARTAFVWLPATGLLVTACASQSARGAGPAATASGDSGSDSASADVTFSADERQVLASFAPKSLPTSGPDPSNKYADDANAALFGHDLFLDPAFSGPLLDADDNGGPNSLGSKGQTGRVACAGCHLPKSQFSDSRSAFGEISLGAGWTRRRSPSLLDVGQAKIVMWGGRFSALWAQPFGPLENPLEMNSSRLYAAEQIAQRYKSAYEGTFGQGSLDPLADPARFPVITADKTGCTLTMPVDHPRTAPPSPVYTCHGMPGDAAEYDAMKPDDQQLVTRVIVNMGKAIAAYERHLACGPGRFDAWVAGDATALTPSEQRGAKLFIGKGNCATCHSGPFFSDQKFHNVGLQIVATREGILNDNDHGASVDLAIAKTDPLSVTGSFSDGNDGRLPDTIGPEYEGAFRTPTLRCVSKRPSFMHTGTTHSLEEAVAFFSRGGDPTGFAGTNVLTRVQLASSEIADVAAFLRSLEGPNASTQ